MALHGASLVASPGLNSDLKQQSLIPVLGLAGISEYPGARRGLTFQTLKWLLQPLLNPANQAGNLFASG